MAKKILIIAVTFLVILFAVYGLFEVSKSRSFQFFGSLTSRVETNRKVIALTFDDAPTAYTGEVLDILKSQEINATFYAIGENIKRYPEEAKAIATAGMEIGNHSYSHPRFYFKSQTYIDREIRTTSQLIRETGYRGEITFRPPNGKKLFGLPWYLMVHNIRSVTWDIEPDTYYKGDTAKIAGYVLDNAKPGSIILMHPFCEGPCEADRQALPRIIAGLKAKGYRFVTVSELLKLKE